MRVGGWPAFKNRLENPYNWLLYSNLSRIGVDAEEFSPVSLVLGRYDIWHVHWPDFGLSFGPLWRAIAWSAVVTGLAAIAHLRRTRIVWTVHNLQTHETRHPRLEAAFWRVFARQIDGLICMSQSAVSLARRRFPQLADTPAFVIPHGEYRAAYPDNITRAEARARLSIPPGARVIGFIGQLRPYKNVPVLIRAFRDLPDSDLRLIVAGEAHTAAIATELRQLADSDSRVCLFTTAIPETDVQVYMRAADLIALPYSQVLNSGTALLALSFERPVLVPRLGAMAELEAEVSASWVRTFVGALEPRVLADALIWACDEPRDSSHLLEPFDWRGIAAKTVAAYTVLRPTGG